MVFGLCARSSSVAVLDQPTRDEPSNDGPGQRQVNSAPSGDDSPAMGRAAEMTLKPVQRSNSDPRVTSITKDEKPAPAAQNAVSTTGVRSLTKAVSEFVVEGDGVSSKDVDSYLESVLGSRITKALRASEWASRVSGLEALGALLANTSDEPHTAAERTAQFKAGISIVARLLQDKVVPVFLPALATVRALYSAHILQVVPADLPAKAVPIFATQIVMRASSSNVRAREEASGALRYLARAVDPTAVCPVALRPPANNKGAPGLVSRLELLHALVEEHGIGSRSGLGSDAVLHFVAPLAENAAQQVREAALAVVALMRPELTDAMLKLQHPALAAKLLPPDKRPGSEPLGISGRRLPPLRIAPAAAGSDGVEGLSLGADGAARSTPAASLTRSHARQTATELGHRSPPGPAGSRGARKKQRPTANGDAALKAVRGRCTLLNQAEALIGEGVGGNSNMETPRRALFDEVDENLMDSILNAE